VPCTANTTRHCVRGCEDLALASSWLGARYSCATAKRHFYMAVQSHRRRSSCSRMQQGPAMMEKCNAFEVKADSDLSKWDACWVVRARDVTMHERAVKY
jgi:hypothetical protein